MNKKGKGRISGQFVPLLHEMMDCPPYLSMSHGARCLYQSLKRRAWQNRAYLSYRTARKELGSSPHKIKEWFAELEHYGSTVLAQHGSLGVDGKGKAPHWRLTELGHVAGSGTEFPTKEYIRWDGVLFDPRPYRDSRGSTRWVEKQNPVSDVRNTLCRTYITPPLPTSITPNLASVSDGVHIGNAKSVSDGLNISRLTTTVVPGSPSTPSLSGSDHFGPDDRRMKAISNWGANAKRKVVHGQCD